MERRDGGGGGVVVTHVFQIYPALSCTSKAAPRDLEI